MTELDTLKRAQVYLDKLSVGINPITGERVSEGDAVTNPRISKCLTYVSEVLGRVIENSGRVGRAPRAERTPFRISPEVLGAFIPTVTPLTASELVGKINALAESEGGCSGKLRVTAITEWLTESGFLKNTERESGGKIKKSKLPTPQGEEIGIKTVAKIGRTGVHYTAVVYTKAAQQFIIDNMSCFADVSDAPAGEVAPAKETDFSPEDDRLILRMHNGGAPIRAIAGALRRGSDEIARRLSELGAE